MMGAGHNQMPKVITNDKYPASEAAIAEEIYLGDPSVMMQHLKVKYLNNIVELNHRLIKSVLKSNTEFKIINQLQL